MEQESLQSSLTYNQLRIQLMAELMDKRPQFVDKKRLRMMYPCVQCKQIVLQAQQTCCANRVCQNCIEEIFGTHDIIRPCPLPHDDINNDEYDCKEGLQRRHVFKDVAAMKDLSRAKVYCGNRKYGCELIVIWIKQKEHMNSCPYKPVRCSNEGCDCLFAADKEAEHIASCPQTRLRCRSCHGYVLCMDLKDVEMATSYGALTWVIADYDKKKSDAAKGSSTSMYYCHPFYTAPKGYKICVKVYPNGDCVGCNQYLSVFFVVMRGEYDNLLEWPFQQKVTFQLIHPRNGGVKEQSCRPDPTSPSTQKPKSDMNIASGCPKFIKYAGVKNKYLFDGGAICLRIKVDRDKCCV